MPESWATDVLIVGAGAAGLSAARAARKEGADVTLVDKGLIGLGGASVMAQMTVAVALGSEEPDDWTLHYQDTLASGRGLCGPALAELLTREAPARIMECADLGVHWARRPDGGIRQVAAPGHSRKRCIWVDYLASGKSITRALKRDLRRSGRCRELKNVAIHRLLVADGEVAGAVGFDLVAGELVVLQAKSVVLATGGCTHLYERSSSSINMTGDGHALALRAGAELVDMEFVQCVPIGTIYPHIIGLHPVTWEAFRSKLGGKLLNGLGEEFVERYADDVGQYTATRDVATYAILKEVAAGRGSPHGGVYLDFRAHSRERLREAFDGIIDVLERQGVDLTQRPVEVAPLAHYTTGGIRVNDRLETTVPGLYAAGEAAGGAHGANRLSGNALVEALTFGHRAGEQAARRCQAVPTPPATAASESEARDSLLGLLACRGDVWPTDLRREVQRLMWSQAGPLRHEAGLAATLARLQALRRRELNAIAISGPPDRFNLDVLEGLNLDHGLLAAEAIVRSAQARRESRGAHHREDYPQSDDRWLGHHRVSLARGEIVVGWQADSVGGRQ